MINKIADSAAQAMAGVRDGATVLIGGFGTAGIPGELIDALIAQGARDLTVVNNNAGNADHGLAALLKAGRVRRIICSFPRQLDRHVFDELYRSGTVKLGLVPQDDLAERLRAAGAGIGAMHYIGMEASEWAPIMRFDPWGFAASLLVAVLLAIGPCGCDLDWSGWFAGRPAG